MRDGTGGRLLSGLAAGAAGVTALNAVTYLDMIMRSRPPSQAPEELVGKTAGALGDHDQDPNRRSGVAGLLGIATGVVTGGMYGLARAALPARTRVPVPIAALALGAAAQAASDVPLTVTGISRVSTWSGSDWLSDAIPHLAYGVVAAITFEALTS
ncbi:hypothetical protein [Bailinhaonella thermotolerans]|uniref:DUF1440 domain-containing protein n=1 Tax=Bailinhaonella thermotolerans TaxID=1070861 RepID=A0A3A4APF0_9ACTN|nr:hypothetical protein [Bailinhaonella thermotolerans]RJL30325.1 hypothetical protein D5H75_22330 [Bailinhaonella thermotolerans]